MEKLPLEIVSKEGFHAIEIKNSAVAVILYTLDENDLLDKVGTVIEKNPHFPGGSYTGLVMGAVESDDPSLLFRAKAETLEEAGFNVEDNIRWNFLGEIYTSKLLTGPVYCYSADVTGLDSSSPQGDGSPQEEGIKFSMLPLNRAQEIPDALFQACFFKLFSKLYKTQLA